MDAIIVYNQNEFFKVYRQRGNERGLWIVYADRLYCLDCHNYFEV
jgi:hypothetical protein